MRDGARSVLPSGFKPSSMYPAWMKPVPKWGSNNKAAVAQFGSNEILWYPRSTDRRNAPPINCEPATATNGIAIDRRGNLWIPNGQADTTTEYGPNCGAAKLTISDTTGEPADVTIDNFNNVYILNLNNISGPPTVNVYNYSGKFLRTLSDPSFNILFGIRADIGGDVFVSNLTSSNVGNVVEFKNGRMPGADLSGPHLGLPGAPAIDSAGNLVIADWLAMTIDVFAPPYSGSPKTATLMGQSIWCPIGHYQQRVFCGDAQYGSIDVYDYPTLNYMYSYTAGLSPDNLVTGVAPYPPSPY